MTNGYKLGNKHATHVFFIVVDFPQSHIDPILPDWIISMELILRVVLACILSLPILSTAYAVEKITVTVEGEADLGNRTPEEAQKAALERARSRAVETACGVTVQSESLVRESILQSDFIHTVSYGNIIAEKVLKWGHDMYQKSPEQPPQFSYRVTLLAEVQKEEGNSDPSYAADLKLNKAVYHSGDEMIMKVKVSKASYVNILNFTADNKVTLLFPNRIRTDNHLEKGKTYQIPSAKDRDGILKLQVSNLSGHKKDMEYIKIIATTSPLNLLDMLSTESQYGVMDTIQTAATEVSRLIVKIPLKDRAEKTVTYQVVSE